MEESRRIVISSLVIAIITFIWLIGFFIWYIDQPSFNTIKVESSSKMEAVYQKKPLRILDLKNNDSNPRVDVSTDDTNITYILNTTESSPAFNYTFLLPNSDGSGHQYEFILNFDFDTSQQGGFVFGSVNTTDLFFGSAVTSNGAITKYWSPYPDGRSGIDVDDLSPFVKTSGTAGLRKGSRWTFVDYTKGTWLTRIDNIGYSDVTEGGFANPFTGEN